MMIAPQAEPYDGWLDLCLVKSAPRWDVLRMVPRVFSGGHIRHPAVSMHTVRKLEMSSPEPLWLWADGEPVTQLPATLEVVPGSLDVLVPDGGRDS